jgi:tetratricopeptide (TPR) repeat protein
MASPSDASQFLREGQSCQFAEPPKYAAAEKAYRAAAHAAPEWGEPYHWLGMVLERQGHTQEAAQAYQRAIHLLGGDPRPLIALGDLQRRRGQHKEAIASLEAGLALKPHYAEADARLILADALESSGNVEQAVAQWRVVAQMQPSYPSGERPMEEARRKLAEHGVVAESFNDEELVAAYLRHFATRDDALFWAWERIQQYVRTDPRKAWGLTLQLIAVAPDQSALGYIAAGPLEDLLYARGELFIDELERLARSDPKFLSALQMISGPFTRESDVSNRIVKAAGITLPCVDEDWP